EPGGTFTHVPLDSKRVATTEPTLEDGATVKGPDEPAPAPAPRPGAAEPQLAIGQVLGGCRVETLLGKGGMGRVYRGHHDGLDRDLAVKVLDETLVARKGFVQQFLLEARTLAKL